MLTICIFARSSTKTPTNIFRFSDQLIASASFVMDKIDSILLSWIGVVEKTLAQFETHSDYQHNNTPLRKEFNIGTFLLILCQVLKSTIQKKDFFSGIHCNYFCGSRVPEIFTQFLV